MTTENKKELRELKGARIIDIKDVLPTFYFDNKATLFLECPWRLVANDKQIIIGDIEFKGESTHRQGMKILKNEVLNRKIVDFEIKEGLRDLQVKFEGNIRMDVFVGSALYESWNLHIGKRNFIGTPGGQISVF